MSKKKKEITTKDIKKFSNASLIQNEYMLELERNPKYSLEVDPENKYLMSELQKKFTKYYIEFKNVNTAAELAEIDMDTAKQFFISYPTQCEIRRINLALYQRQFANKLLSIDEIGGYLTSLLTDEFVPMGDQLKTTDKLKVAQMLIDLNRFKIESMVTPSEIMEKDLDSQMQELSIDTIKNLISTNKKKQDIASQVSDELSPEETAYLSTLPTNELLKLIDKEKNNDAHNDNV